MGVTNAELVTNVKIDNVPRKFERDSRLIIIFYEYLMFWQNWWACSKLKYNVNAFLLILVFN